MFERFSEAARLALFAARLEVTESASDAIGPKHLLLGLLEAKGAIAEALAGEAGLIAEDIRPHLMTAAPTPLLPSIEVPFAPEARAALQAAVAEADAMACREITTGHLLIGLVRDERSEVSMILREGGLALNHLRTVVQARAMEGPEPVPPTAQERLESRFRALGL